MDQLGLIDGISEQLADDTAVRGLFLGGSYGRRTADEYSDVDLIALVEAGHRAKVVSRFRAALQAITEVVHWQERGSDRVLANAVTGEWLRCDFYVIGPADFTRRARDTVRPLIDRDGFHDALPASLPAREPDARKVAHLINEFIRVLGLLAVVIGRDELVTAVDGAGQQRGHLAALLQGEAAHPDTGGALHLSKIIPPEDMNMLLALPYPGPERKALLDAHLEIARRFFPRARALAERLEIEWPVPFEAATRRLLKARFGEDRIDW